MLDLSEFIDVMEQNCDRQSIYHATQNLLQSIYNCKDEASLSNARELLKECREQYLAQREAGILYPAAWYGAKAFLLVTCGLKIFYEVNLMQNLMTRAAVTA